MFPLSRRSEPRFTEKKTRDYDLAGSGYTLIMSTGDSWVYSPAERSYPTIIVEVVLGEWYGYRVQDRDLKRSHLTDKKSWKDFLKDS